jgi:hypothetical protein
VSDTQETQTTPKSLTVPRLSVLPYSPETSSSNCSWGSGGGKSDEKTKKYFSVLNVHYSVVLNA